MKKSFLSLLIATGLFLSIPTKKADAGVVAFVGGFVVATTVWPANVTFFSMVIGGPVAIVGSVLTAIPATMAIGIPILILGEDGSLSLDQLESILSEKYDFIADREVIASLATAIKTKAETMKADSEGKVVVSLSEAEVKNILAPIEDLSSEEMNLIVQDLK